MKIGTGIAIAGIWIGAGIAMAFGKQDSGVIAMFAMFASLGVALFDSLK